MDLEALTKREGTQRMASVVRVTHRAFRDIRSGRHALTIDHMLLLSQTFPDFDVAATVQTLGQRRVQKARTFYQLAESRKVRP